MSHITLIVMSRARPQNGPHMSALFPSAYWCVSHSEAKDYKEIGGIPTTQIIEHPDDVLGIGKTRQWILDNIQGDIFMLDDDIEYLWCNVGETGRRIEGAENILQVIENAAEIAGMMGAPIFGFNQAWDVRKFSPFDPLGFTGWVGTAVGFIGRDIRYDQDLVSQADIDFCLKSLLEKRVIFIDKRFAFSCKRFNNAGGSAGVQNFSIYKKQVEIVTERWRGWLKIADAKTTVRLKVDVPRKQPVEIF